MSRILITGSRDWTDEALIHAALARLAVLGDTLVHGACEFGGADTIAAEYWAERGTVEAHPASNFRHLGRDRYKARNQHMVDLGADVCLVFAKSWFSGTGQCARMARIAGIPTVDFGVSTEARSKAGV